MNTSHVLATVGGTAVRQFAGETAFFFVAGMAIDADGAPRAYHRNGSPPGLDALANAGEPGNWWALVTRNGRPIVQGPDDPAPGFFVSTTSLVYKQPASPTNPRHYVDASSVPYVVLPTHVLRAGHAHLGDFAAVWNRRTKKLALAIVADIGPPGKLGEGSIALARATGVPESPKTGGQGGDVVYLVFPGSGNRFARPAAAIDRLAAQLFEDWGGLPRLKRVRA